MATQTDWLNQINLVFDRLSRQTVKRGRSYFNGGRVLKLNCIKPEQHYQAVVQGGENYQVDLMFDEDWEINCSCPIGIDCKHGVAALLKLQGQAGGKAASPVVEGRAPSQFPLSKQNALSPRESPPSPLLEKLSDALGGRKLRRNESAFVQRVRMCWNRANRDGINESDLLSLTESGNSLVPYFHWKPIPLWAKRPPDEFRFWLHVAWELRRRNLPWPAFMDGITDLRLIEPAMRKWERDKEIEAWKTRFQMIEQSPPPQSSAGQLELRLVIFPEEARFQWRLDPGNDFAEFKQTHAKNLGSHFDNGTLSIAPASLPLWGLTYKPWSYEKWWIFRYTDSTAVPSLGRLLRAPLAAGCVVKPDGQPFPRFDLPLRLDLAGPGTPDGSYRLSISPADGSPMPRIFCIFRGTPTLYLTADGLFRGPYAAILETDSQKEIPAGAAESAEGLRFLHSCGAPLPASLQQRILTVPTRVTIACSLQPAYSGAAAEDILIKIKAEAPETETETFTLAGWRPTQYRPTHSQTKSSPDSITIADRRIQAHFPAALDMLGARWDNYSQQWRLRLTKKAPEVFVQWLKSLPSEIEVLLNKELATLRDEPISGSVAFDVDEAGIDWFDLRIKLEVSDTTLTPEELNLLLNARGGYVRLGKKGWRRLQYNLSPEEDQQLARLGLHARDFSGEPQRIHALQLADNAATKFLGPDRAKQIHRHVDELKTRVTPLLPDSVKAILRPYQTEGFHFLAYLTANRFGGVLADDMGLGKTLQTLSWLALLRETPPGGQPAPLQPALVVCPKSVMDNWRGEAERFYPGLKVRLWNGEPAENLKATFTETDLLVINYSQLRALSPEIATCQWLAVILDEAQYIKNPDSQTAQAARALQTEHRLALTGTPIENRLLDLWSIFSFAMPGVLGNRSHFLQRFDAKNDPLARRRLAARVRPFLLRRTKAQVARDLPDRVEEDLFCEMEAGQKTLYRAELKRARQIMLGLKTNRQLNQERFNILTSLLRLRQICCHPALIDKDLREAPAAKLSALEDMLEPLMAEGHKVLVFSQFVTMLDILRDTIKQRNWPYFYLAGDTENRGELVRQFQNAKGGAVFLISLKAGGFGLNLTAASYVVLFDPWWNPAVENQAIDRTHRIGQTRKVIAYRLLMRETIEQKIRQLQKQKGALADDVLGEERFAQSLTLDDLHFLFAD